MKIRDWFWKISSRTHLLLAGAFVPLNPDIQSNPNSLLGRAFADTNGNLGQFFNNVFHGAVIIGAVLAVLRIVYAGYLYMLTDVYDQKTKARDTLRDAIFGLLLLLAVYLILNQINPTILNLGKVQLPALPASGN